MRRRAFLILLGLVCGLIPTAPAQGVYGGTEVKGSPLVLTLLTSKYARTSFCSMSLLTERIVVTAAHCVIQDQGVAPNLRWNISDIYVSQPGADVTKDDVETRVRVLKVVTRDDFINTWKPEINDRRTQINDIAFLFLEKPLVKGYAIEIATDDEVNRAIANADMVTHYGYGLQTSSSQSHSPWTTQLQLVDRSDSHVEKNKVLYTREGPTAMCPGDSGGPFYINVNGVQKIAGVLVAASGCRGLPPYNGGTLGTRIAPYMAMAQLKWDEFIDNEDELRQREKDAADTIESARQEAIAKGWYTSPGGCHVKGINAELQAKQSDGKWVLIAPAMGWISSDTTCPATHSVQPWAISKMADGTMLRWRFWSSGWDILGEEFRWNNQYRDPALLPQTPKPTISKAPVVPLKKVTITCKKGLLTKKVSGVKPLCPKGWRKS